MIVVNGIKNGIVIDHIKAGLGNQIFKYLGLDKADYSVALIKNVSSNKLGKKDIIKIENTIDLNYEVLGIIDSNITINIIENGAILKKVKPNLPDRVEDIIKCKNPRCITSVEPFINHIFYLSDKDKGEYRCFYCDEAYSAEV